MAQRTLLRVAVVVILAVFLMFTETHDGSGQNNDIESQRGLFVLLK